MKCVLQRVKKASVTIENELYSEIKQGILVLACVEKEDTEEKIEWMSNKIVNLRIFEDETGKMNKSVKDIGGELLVVSQFTLAGDCKKGTRPSFDKAEKPEIAKKMYEKMINKLKSLNIETKTGVFQAMMDIELINDGPVTIILEK